MLDNAIFLHSLDALQNDYTAINELHPRQRRQSSVYMGNNIVTECCKKACTIRTIKSYCAEVEHVDRNDYDEMTSQ